MQRESNQEECLLAGSDHTCSVASSLHVLACGETDDEPCLRYPATPIEFPNRSAAQPPRRVLRVCGDGSKPLAVAHLGWFSPGFELDGKDWSTVEHYFQAAKFFGTDEEWAEQIRQAATPAKAKTMGRSREHPLRRDWEQAKDDVMRTAVRRNSRCEELRKNLIAMRGMKTRGYTRAPGCVRYEMEGQGPSPVARVVTRTRY